MGNDPSSVKGLTKINIEVYITYCIFQKFTFLIEGPKNTLTLFLGCS